MYIPEQRALRLLEIQESVLPEDEWLLGVSDLGYFRGMGFSMPVSFVDYVPTGNHMMLGAQENVCDIVLESPESDLDFEQDDSDSWNDPLFAAYDNVDPLPIESSVGRSETGAHVDPPEEMHLTNPLNLDVEPLNLYAFLPGLFYCSRQRETADGVLIEVTQKDLLGMTLGSFRPENVRTFDVPRELATHGKDKPVPVTTVTEPLVTLGASRATEQAIPQQRRTNWETVHKRQARRQEINVGIRLANTVSLGSLKKEYVSGAVLAGRLGALLKDIGERGIIPRRRVYVRNRKYPMGTVIETRYRRLDGILSLTQDTGIECPDDVDVGLELSKLSFTKLVGAGTEVGVEEAIVEMHQFIYSKLSHVASEDRIAQVLFTEAGK